MLLTSISTGKQFHAALSEGSVSIVLNVLDPLINEIEIYFVASLNGSLSKPINQFRTAMGRGKR
jgi:hypothetical protein